MTITETINLKSVHSELLRIRKEVLTIDQFKELNKFFNDSKEELIQSMKSYKVVELKYFCQQQGTGYHAKKKDEYIKALVDSLEAHFYLGRSVSYTWGEKTHNQAVKELIEGTTQETLDKFYSERKEKVEKNDKALNNPETIEEFRTFCSEKGIDKLNLEQFTKYNTLVADRSIQMNEQEKERQNSRKVKNVLSTASFDIVEGKHTKTQETIFIAKVKDRVEKDEFYALKAKAKQLAGYYSKFVGGFLFNTLDHAKAFAGNEEVEQSEDIANDTPQKRIERIKASGQKLIDSGEESLNQERTTNTHRQIEQASHAQAKAEKQIKIGKTLLHIAEKNNELKYIKSVSNKVEIEQFESILMTAYWFRVKADKLNSQSTERDFEKEIRFVKFPVPIYNKETIVNILEQSINIKGLTLESKRMLKSVNRCKEGIVTVTDKGYIDTLKKIASTFSDAYSKDRILEPIKNHERMFRLNILNRNVLIAALIEYNSLKQLSKITPEQAKAKQLKELENSFKLKKIAGFFPTPSNLTNHLLDLVNIQTNETVCEPSAGLGHIADIIKERHPSNELNLIEYSYQLWDALHQKGHQEAENENFLYTSHKYDVFVMNPPFENGQDIDHVTHAFKLLKSGGRLAAIVAGNKQKQDKKTIEFMELVNEFGHIEDNETGAFKSAFRSTGVNTCTVYLEKP